MFEREIAINQFLIGGLRKVAADIPEEKIYERAPGNGHPPVWIFGHLAIVAELGLGHFGVASGHPAWFPIFGPGSKDHVKPDKDYSKALFMHKIEDLYPRLCHRIQEAQPDLFARPHGAAILANTPIKNVGEILAHLLTSHFSFHLAQLSGWRRSAGFGPLY